MRRLQPWVGVALAAPLLGACAPRATPTDAVTNAIVDPARRQTLIAARVHAGWIATVEALQSCQA